MLLYNERAAVLNFFEGCNGLNVMIVFLAFMAAFGGNRKNILWFIPLGLLIIYFANLARLTMLYYVAEYFQSYFYFVHKYLFTAVIYVIVFGLWTIWIMKYGRSPKADAV
jgi:exosortase family protein XrtF